jgi:homoserine kinase
MNVTAPASNSNGGSGFDLQAMAWVEGCLSALVADPDPRLR